MKYDGVFIEDSHRHSRLQSVEILNSQLCGCFFCLKTFQPQEINNWSDGGKTALCPYCEIDTVIGDNSGLPVSDIHFLDEMNKFWFEGHSW